MGFVEAIPRKVRHQLEKLLGFLLVEAVFQRALQKISRCSAMTSGFLAHGAPQQIGESKEKPAMALAICITCS